MLVDDEEALDRLFEQARLPIMTHCEDGAMIAENMAACKAQYGDDPDVALHSRIRSAEACYASTAEAVRLAKNGEPVSTWPTFQRPKNLNFSRPATAG